MCSVLLPCREEILTVATDAEAAEISGTQLLLKEEEAAIGKILFILSCCPVFDALNEHETSFWLVMFLLCYI